MRSASRAGFLALLLAGSPMDAGSEPSSAKQLDAVEQALLQPFTRDWDQILPRQVLRALVGTQ